MTLLDTLHQYKNISPSQLKTLWSLFDKRIKTNTSYYILVSWWQDSMLLSTLIFYYYFTRWLDMSLLSFVHYNHQQRKESEDEELFIRQFFKWTSLYIWSYAGVSYKEKDLREARWSFVSQTMRWSSCPVVVTGHHLQDRFEWSCLHMMRWSWVFGICNMQEYAISHIHWDEYTIFRPLLWLTKSEVSHLISEFSIPFVTDLSNFDVHCSKRNYIRKIHKDILSWSTTYYTSLKNMYGYINAMNNDVLPLVCHLYCRERQWVKKAYKACIPKNEQQVYMVLKNVWAIAGTTNSRLSQLFSFFQKSSSWWKYFSWRYIHICHWYIYLVYTWDPHPYWYTPLDNTSMLVDETWSITIHNEAHTIDPSYVWCICRHPKTWDMFWSIKLMRYLSKKHIPHFLRNWLFVLARWNKVMYILYDKPTLCIL